MFMPKRADYIVQNATVECDTRDRKARLAELRATLKTLIAEAARDPQIDLGARTTADEDTGEEIIIPLAEANFDSMVSASRTRTDVSTISIVIKTPVGRDESGEQAGLDRIDDFASNIKVTGRAVILVDDGFALSIVNPNQYRSEIIRRVAADAKTVSQGVGTGYDVKLSCLERQVYWTRSGPLDLDLFIPYGLSVVPREVGESWHIGAMTKNRLEAFSDGVIAIIITIMVLELRAPHGHRTDFAPAVVAGFPELCAELRLSWHLLEQTTTPCSTPCSM